MKLLVMFLTNQHFFSSVCENKCCLVIMNFIKKHISNIGGVQCDGYLEKCTTKKINSKN